MQNAVRAPEKFVTIISPCHFFLFDSVENERWVRDHVTDFLESKEHSYKLCMHNRDFVPGNTILHNICTSIKHSRRLIAVVTR